MLFLLPFLTLLFLGSFVQFSESEIENVELLERAVKALHKALQFMEDNIQEINLDGVFGVRLTEEYLQAFMEQEPDVASLLGVYTNENVNALRLKARNIANEAIKYIKVNEPEYYHELGGLLEPSEVLLWYPSRTTKPELIVKALSCKESYFNESMSDHCMESIIGSKEENISRCTIHPHCIQFMSKPKQRDYMITHQVLYFQILEKEKCLNRSQIPESLQMDLCSNVMRDAQMIAESNFPADHRDLFMEQIGLCGIWGFKDFYNPEWLANILDWQTKIGCYAQADKWICRENLLEHSRRVKRVEKILHNGCLSHKTTVALLAIVVNIRFIADEVFTPDYIEMLKSFEEDN